MLAEVMRMARKGRELEELVALIEGVMVPHGATVKSPDFVDDRVTGHRREVDVSVRMKVGSTEILIVLECRDRDVEDVTWIEQLAQKCRDLKVSKVIAVSSAGFSSGARVKAAHEGIELRRMEDLLSSDIEGWFEAGALTYALQRVEISHVSFNLDPAWRGTDLGDELRGRLSKLTPQDKILVCKSDGLECGLDSVWAWVRDPKVYDGVSEDGTIVERTLELNYPNPAQRYQLRVGDGELVDIAGIHMCVKLWMDTQRVPIERARAYRGDDGQVAQAVQYRVDVNGEPRLLSFVNAGGAISVGMTTPEEPKR
jgi:hypothetical protein